MRAKIISTAPDPRWNHGEVGILLEHSSDKYDYLVRLEGTEDLPDFLGGVKMNREYFFYRDEVELLND
jgi:hypothetical protein